MQSSKPSFQQVQADKPIVNCLSNMPVQSPLLYSKDLTLIIWFISASLILHMTSPQKLKRLLSTRHLLLFFFPSHTHWLWLITTWFSILGRISSSSATVTSQQKKEKPFTWDRGRRENIVIRANTSCIFWPEFPQRRNLFCRFLLAFPSWPSSRYFKRIGSFWEVFFVAVVVLFGYITSNDPAATLTPEMMTHQKSWGPGKVPGRKKKTEKHRASSFRAYYES